MDLNNAMPPGTEPHRTLEVDLLAPVRRTPNEVHLPPLPWPTAEQHNLDQTRFNNLPAQVSSSNILTSHKEV